MRLLGFLVLGVGLIWGMVAFNMDVTVETESRAIFGTYIPSQKINNIGKMDDRRNHLGGAGLAILVGVLLIGFGSRPASNSEPSTSTLGSRQCPFCAETIQQAAKLCRYCGKDLPEVEVAVASAPASTEKTMKPGYSPCPSCGAAVNNESVKCWACDQRIRQI